MYTFQFFKTYGEFIFYIASRIGIVSELYVIVKTEFLFRDTQAQVPFHALFFPVFVPLFLGARADKKLHLHLLKFEHTENELAGNDLVTESLTGLGNTKRYFHPAGLLYV